MKQTYAYNHQKNRSITQLSSQKYHNRSIITQPSTNLYHNPITQRTKTSIASTNILKTTQNNQKYRIITGSKSLNSKESGRKHSQGLEQKQKKFEGNDYSCKKSQENLSLKSFSLCKHTWKQVLDEQKRYMNKLQKLKKQNKLLKNNSPYKDHRNSIRYNTPPRIKKQSKIKTQPLKLSPRPLESYKAFICSSIESRYSVGFNFTYLRNLSRKQITSYVSFKETGIIQSLQLCSLDVLESNSEKKSESDNNLLREYCVLYFKQFQKNLIQLVLLHHYFKIDQIHIFSFFLNCRIYFYTLHELSLQYIALQNDYKSLLCGILKKIIGIQKLIFNGAKGLSEQTSYVSQTFKLLKITSQVQKLLPSFIQNINQLIYKAQKVGKIETIIQELKQIPYQLMPQNLFQCLIQHEVCLSWNFLCVPPIPHLPPARKKFTLVIGIEGVLTHYDQQTKYLLLRPYLSNFFSKIQGQFQIVGFSNQEKVIADQIIDGLEKNQCHFDYRLYKEHLSIKDGYFQKDITKLGRETERILLIDTEANAPGICKISKFVGEKKDKSLMTLGDRLKVFIRDESSDISTMGSIFCSLQDIIQQNQQNTLTLTIDLKAKSKNL